MRSTGRLSFNEVDLSAPSVAQLIELMGWRELPGKPLLRAYAVYRTGRSEDASLGPGWLRGVLVSVHLGGGAAIDEKEDLELVVDVLDLLDPSVAGGGLE